MLATPSTCIANHLQVLAIPSTCIANYLRVLATPSICIANYLQVLATARACIVNRLLVLAIAITNIATLKLGLLFVWAGIIKLYCFVPLSSFFLALTIAGRKVLYLGSVQEVSQRLMVSKASL